jgi:hypothetical protein
MLVPYFVNVRAVYYSLRIMKDKIQSSFANLQKNHIQVPPVTGSPVNLSPTSRPAINRIRQLEFDLHPQWRCSLTPEGACRSRSSFLLSIRSPNVRDIICRTQTTLLSGHSRGLDTDLFCSSTFYEVSQLERNVSATLLTICEWRNSLVYINRIPLDILSLFPTFLS